MPTASNSPAKACAGHEANRTRRLDQPPSPVTQIPPPARLATRAASFRYGGRHHSGIPGDIIPLYPGDFVGIRMEQGPSFRVSVPKYPTKDPNHRILARQRSRFTHDYFYIRDEVLGPMVMRVATFFPFQTTYYLNGHNFIERELNRAQVVFRKNDNAFLAIDDVAALQAAADRLSPDIIRERLDYWTLILGPKFSVKERKRV